jgi:hypothetical protein
VKNKILLALAVATTTLLVAAPALANQSDPHAEEADGCDHGATGKPCKDDPQPDHGQDCVVHGNHGGINEDHCAPAEVTIATVPPTTTTTTTEPPSVPLTPESPSAPPAGPTVDTPAPPAVQPTVTAPPVTLTAPDAAAVTELATTGTSTTLALIGLLLLLAGASTFLVRRALAARATVTTDET